MRLRDVTLREGEQRPEVTYTIEQKVAAAQKLDALGVDTVQLGFPVADDRTRRVAEQVSLDARTSGIARAVRGDIDAAVAADVDVVDLFAPTSRRQLDAVIGTSRNELAETVVDTVQYAHDRGIEVVFNAMDGFRTAPKTLSSLFETIDVEAFVLADTVGSRTPTGVSDLLKETAIPPSQLGVHFHDDLGVATANALTAAQFGVEIVDVSVAGLGERAGNVPLEEFVVATRVEDESNDVDVTVDQLLPTTQAVLDVLNESVAESKPLLGASAFAHESGIHTAAMLDDPATFEPFDPDRFGGDRRLLFGPSTGRGAAKRLLRRVGTSPTEERVEALLGQLTMTKEACSLSDALDIAETIE